jgi:hypothetical protein
VTIVGGCMMFGREMEHTQMGGEIRPMILSSVQSLW